MQRTNGPDTFRHCCESEDFTVCIELPVYKNDATDELVRFIKEAGKDGRIAAIALPAVAVDSNEFTMFLEEMQGSRIAPLLYFPLADGNRHALFRRLETANRHGLENLLVISGDYPAEEYGLGNAKPVFDFDSVQMLAYLSGRLSERMPAAPSQFSSMYRGCMLHPAKTREAEVIGQYAGLLLKIKAGADYLVVEAGSDMRKYQEVMFFLGEQGISIPVLAALQVDDFAAAFVQPAPGEDSSLLAKAIAVLRGLGLQGVILRKTPPDFAKLEALLDEESAHTSHWGNFPPQFVSAETSFYLYEQDVKTGLNSARKVPLTKKKIPHPLYLLSWLIDWMAFDRRGPLYKIMGHLCLACEKKRSLKKGLIFLEHLSKGLLYGCTLCGDCKLYACAFLCPHAGCPKQQLNGPCGGSVDGFCEVYPGEKPCFWVQVIDRLRDEGRPPYSSLVFVPPKDWRLDRSSWINFFAGRDHRHIDFHGKG